MSQTAVNLNTPKNFAGMKSDSRFDEVESFIAEKEIEFGRGLGANSGEESLVHQVVVDEGKMLFDADFVASNLITITVNGVAAAGVTFVTDHATTSAAVLVAIQALAAVTTASISDPGTDREFQIETTGVAITVTETVTGGASQATGTFTATLNDVFRGISLHHHTEVRKIGETANYQVNDAVSVLRKGRAVVETSGTVAADQAAFVDVAGGIGKFTATSSGNLATGGKFRTAVTGAGLADLEINLP